MKTDPNEPINPDVSISEVIGNPKYTKEIFRHQAKGGLTKREHFAGLAMQGYISADYTANSGMPFDSMALWSVKMADALIAELNRTQE